MAKNIFYYYFSPTVKRGNEKENTVNTNFIIMRIHTYLKMLVIPLLLISNMVLAQTLSLNEAILLGVRENPNVQQSQLNYVMQKFNLRVQEWQFKPHYAFQASAAFTRANSSGQPTYNTQNFNVQPGVSWQSPIGTQMSLNGINTKTTQYNPGLSLEIMQPLMRGFGKAVVEAALNDARDNEVISRLNVEGTLRNIITDIINAYLNVMTAEQIVKIDEAALSRAKTSVTQTKLFIQAGHKAGNEIVTVEADVASFQTQLANDKNNLQQARYALLAAIGVDPNTPIDFSSIQLGELIHKYHLLSLPLTKKLILQNDIQFQTDQITLHGSTERSLLLAKDNSRWQLNFTADVATGGGSGGGQNAGVNSLFNGVNQNQSVGLTLQIPIDDQQAKQAVMNAQIGLREAEIALRQEKWNKETSAINAWHTVQSAEDALAFAEKAEDLQNKTYQVNYQKYLHGLIDSLDLQTAQQQFISSQQTLLNARINYLKSLVMLDQLIGNTLNTWQVKVRLA